MKYLLYLISFFTLIIVLGFKPVDSKKAVLSADEIKFYELIMEYRKVCGLESIPLSNSLSIVAQTHAKDLAENKPDKGSCNGHSWSKNGPWSSCCYTDDHKEAECMWNKPRELTDYTGDGYEIGYRGPIDDIPDILETWKESHGHNQVIINKGIWRRMEWNAIGVGINGGYANVWFGKETDPAGEVLN